MVTEAGKWMFELLRIKNETSILPCPKKFKLMPLMRILTSKLKNWFQCLAWAIHLCCERKWAMKLTFSTALAAHTACTLLVTVLKLFPWPHLLKDTVHNANSTFVQQFPQCPTESTFVWKTSLLACCDVISLQRNGHTKFNAGNSKISEVRLTYNTTNNCGFEKMIVDFEEMLNLSSVS